MPALTLTPLQHPAPVITRATALVIGPVPLDPQLRRSFRNSTWTLERAEDLIHAIERLRANTVPVVLCGAADWRAVREATRSLNRPPVVFALAQQPTNEDWFDAIEKGVWYVDTRQSDAGHLFALLNHAWRLWTEE